MFDWISCGGDKVWCKGLVLSELCDFDGIWKICYVGVDLCFGIEDWGVGDVWLVL